MGGDGLVLLTRTAGRGRGGARAGGGRGARGGAGRRGAAARGERGPKHPGNTRQEAVTKIGDNLYNIQIILRHLL